MISTQEFEICGKKRGFRFGTYSIRLIEEATGIKDISKMLEEFTKQNLTFLSAYFFACAKHYSHSVEKVKVIDYDEADVNDWTDELGPEEVGRIAVTLIQQYLPKNLTPPAEETGELMKATA